MPEELWEEAASFARAMGVTKVARALGLGFYNLRDRVDQNTAIPVEAPSRFLDLGAIHDLSPEGGASEIEILGRDGSRFRMRIAPGSQLDAASVVAAYMGWK